MPVEPKWVKVEKCVSKLLSYVIMLFFVLFCFVWNIEFTIGDTNIVADH